MQEFQLQRIIKETELIIDADPQTVFPLLCPVREYEWIEPWRCRVRYSESGVAENNCIFETDFPRNGGCETWIVSRYEKGRCIEFVRFTADEKIIKLDVRLTGTQSGGTRLLWRKTFTGLSPEGNRVVAAMAGDFAPEVEGIARMLNYYLSTGKRLSLDNL